MPDAKKAAKTAAKKGTTTRTTSPVFSADERAAIKEYAEESRTSRRRGGNAAAEEADVLAKIAEMADSDRAMAERIHAIDRASAPGLTARTWYGMPAYAKDGKVLCFFQPAQKFKTRYATFGFNDVARLDDGAMWPVAFALTELTAADEKRIGALLAQAAG